jgi:hypothetical protein
VTKIAPSLANNTLTSADLNLGPYTIGVYTGGLSTQENYWWMGEIYLVMMYDRDLSQADERASVFIVCVGRGDKAE